MNKQRRTRSVIAFARQYGRNITTELQLDYIALEMRMLAHTKPKEANMPTQTEIDEMIASYTPEEADLIRELLEDNDDDDITDRT